MKGRKRRERNGISSHPHKTVSDSSVIGNMGAYHTPPAGIFECSIVFCMLHVSNHALCKSQY
jgi:hypothetical protein